MYKNERVFGRMLLLTNTGYFTLRIRARKNRELGQFAILYIYKGVVRQKRLGAGLVV